MYNVIWAYFLSAVSEGFMCLEKHFLKSAELSLTATYYRCCFSALAVLRSLS